MSEEIDKRVCKWTLNALDEYHELERFFEIIPGLYHSEVIEDPETVLGPTRILHRLDDFFRRTKSSNLSPDSVKQRRLVICLNAARAVRLHVQFRGSS